MHDEIPFLQERPVGLDVLVRDVAHAQKLVEDLYKPAPGFVVGLREMVLQALHKLLLEGGYLACFYQRTPVCNAKY